MNTTQTRAELVSRYRHLGRLMAPFETLSESDYNALKRERDQVQAKIDAIDGKADAS